MINALVEVVDAIIRLLFACEYTSRAEWFQQRLDIVRSHGTGSVASQCAIRELRQAIAGMGSFSDLSMIPREGAELTKERANALKWELADQLDDLTAKLLRDEPTSEP